MASVPSPPRNVFGLPGYQKVTITWDVPLNNGGSNIIGYNIYYDINLDGSVLIKIGNLVSSPFIYNDIANVSAVNFLVKAVNGTGESTGAETGHFMIGIPLPPTNIQIIPGNESLIVSWNESVHDNLTITEYNIYNNSNGVNTLLKSLVTSPTTITNLTNGQTYNIRVQVMTNEGAILSDIVQGVPTANNIPCIVEGQRILTQRGYVKVEELVKSDYIITSDNRQVAANVYSFTVNKTTEKTAPITIKANAFAPHSPPNDIRLSPLHAIQRTKGVWDIPIKASKRYENVIQEEPGQSVTYYHIETPNYLKDNLVVEGTIVESFGNNYAKKYNLTPTDIYSWSSTLKGYTRITNASITKNKTK